MHVGDGYAGEHTDVTGRVGIGLSRDVGGVRLTGELYDYVSIFAPGVTNDRTLQNELFLTFEVAPGL